MFSVPKVVRFTHNNRQINDPENVFNSQTNKKWQKIFSDILTSSSHKKTDKTYEIKDFQRDVIDWNGSEDNKDGRVEKMGDYLTKLLKKLDTRTRYKY